MKERTQISDFLISFFSSYLMLLCYLNFFPLIHSTVTMVVMEWEDMVAMEWEDTEDTAAE